MSPEADAIKKHTLECYHYCAEDKVKGYDDLLRIAEQQPDSYWEEQAVAQSRKAAVGS